MENFCQQAGEYNKNNTETPWIEFFLAPELLHEPIDCWKLYKKDKSKLAVTLGCKYTIFTRSSKRLLNNAERPRWLKKWQMLQQQNLNNLKIVFTSNLNSLNELFVALKNDESCILVIDKPYQKQQYTKIVSALEDTGIPIVLWIRENSALTDHQIEIRNLVTGTILEFSEKICEKRSEAFQIEETDLEKKHIGNHLTLIWENPNLYPIDIKYSSP